MTTEYEGLGLTAEELSALTEPDTESTTATQEELEAAAATAVDTPATTPTEPAHVDTTAEATPGATDGAAATPDPAPAATAAEPAPAAASAPAPAEPGAAPSPAVQPAPLLVAQAPDDAKAKLDQIATDKAALRQKYDDGDITFAEYEADKEKLDEQRMDIRLAVEKAETATQMARQQEQNQWNADCNTFLEQHPDLYQGETNAANLADLDAAIKAIAVMPSSAGKSGPQVLAMAHRAVMAARGSPVVATATAPAAAPAKPIIPKPALPPDLGKMPSAGVTDTGEGKWASLDRLQDANPEAYEAALAKLSQAEQDAYLAT